MLALGSGAAVMSYLILSAVTALFGTEQERARAIIEEVRPKIEQIDAPFHKTPNWTIETRSYCPFVVRVGYFISWGPLAGVGAEYSVFWFFGFRRELAGRAELRA